MIGTLITSILYLVIAGVLLYLAFLIIKKFNSPGLFYPAKGGELWGYVLVSLLGGGVIGPLFLFGLWLSLAESDEAAIFVIACLIGVVLTWLCLFTAWIQHLSKKVAEAEKILKIPIIYAALYMAVYFLNASLMVILFGPDF